jgi:glycerol uptake facilitator-like aquaporin
VQAWVSEFAGTAILLFASVLAARWLFGPHSALASAVPGLPGRMAIDAAVIGAIVGSLIISPLGRSSGGHFNPAVTVTLWLLRGLPGRDAAAYIAAQLAGSLAGVMLGRAVLGAVIAHPSVDYAAIQPAAGWSGGAVFAGEAICLAVLMALVVAFLDRPVLLRWTPAVVAVAVAVLIFAGGLTSGGSFNPARQFGCSRDGSLTCGLTCSVPSPALSSSSHSPWPWACRSRSPAACAAHRRATHPAHRDCGAGPIGRRSGWRPQSPVWPPGS